MMNDESPFISWDPLQCHHLLAGNVSQYAWNDGMKYFHDFLMFFDFFLPFNSYWNEDGAR